MLNAPDVSEIEVRVHPGTQLRKALDQCMWLALLLDFNIRLKFNDQVYRCTATGATLVKGND